VGFQPKSRIKLTSAKTCGYTCRDALKNSRPEWIAHLKAIAVRGKAGWTEESRVSYATKMTGAANPAWKGGATYKRAKGNYSGARSVRCPPDLLTMMMANGYIMEHRLVMARWIGRPLTRVECVHHEDHDPLNNARSNLALWPCNRSHKMAEHGRIAIGAANQLSLTA
jgi:hypothetical protein